LTAIFKEDREDFPNGGDDSVLFVAVSDKFLDKLVESDRVHKETSKDSIDCSVWNASVGQGVAVDSIARDRILMFRLQNNSRYVKVLRIS
jgi:hypothetical protein